MTKSILSLALAAITVTGAMAQTAGKPTLRHVEPKSEKSHIMAVSDNGLWGVGQASGDDGTYTQPRLLDVAKGQLIDLFGSNEKDVQGEACDATDDGKIVAGSWKNAPALYYTDSKKWQAMPMPEGKSFVDGKVSAITPDGKFAVGYAFSQIQEDGMVLWTEFPVAWSINGSNIEILDLPDMPVIDLESELARQVRLLQISSDGKYILGQVNFSYPMTSWSFLYNVQDKTWKPLGYKYENGVLMADENMPPVEDGKFSPNAKYLGCSIMSDEGDNVGVIDLSTGKFSIIPDSNGKMFSDVDNFGVVYASAPSIPMRNWSFYIGGYWFTWDLALRQIYGIDWRKDFTKDDYGLTGTYVGTSADGLRLMSADYSGIPGGTYLMTITKPLAELADELDPLGNYNVFPTQGSSFSSVRNITVYFDRPIEVIGERNSVVLYDDKGQKVKSSMQVALEAGQTNNLLISFRNADMEAGKNYTVVIPAGTVQVKGDANRKNKEIRLSYVGRANTPVKPVSISPESGTAMPRLSMTTNPVIVNFDAQLSVIEGGSIGLYRVDSEGKDEFLYALNSTIEGSRMTIFPAVEQELAKGVTYKVVINENTVGDIAGNNGNERLSISYEGTYVPDNQMVDGVVFRQDFNAGFGEMMLYDGDQRTPTSEMASWGFTSQYPWWTARDNKETMEQAAASHSMYSPAGKSDDWMVTPRLYIPDETCALTFDSQSFRKNKEDYLKVYILACDDIYTAPITKSFIDRIKEEGVLVYNEKQDPGKSEDLLEGDWKHNKVELKEYAGKNIYIAFMNDNENQSAVFVDNVLVQRDLEFSIGLTTPAYIVDAESVPVGLVFKVLGDKTYDSIDFRLLDADGKELQKKTVGSLSLNKDSEPYEFTFAEPLALEKGCINNYTVEAKVGEKSVALPSSIKNLRFKPRRTVVLEEGTGTSCPNCPRGLKAVEMMEELYGDQFIPVAIHGYTSGSTFLNAWTAEYAAFLGFQAYPTGLLNREQSGTEFYVKDNDYQINDPENGTTWFDITSRMLSELTDAEVAVDHAYIDPESGYIEVGIKMNYAYDNDNTNINVHTVVLENDLFSFQSNNYAHSTSTLMADWCQGGKYGSNPAPYVFNHVARGMHGNIYAGASGMFPRVIDSSKGYTNTYAFPIPEALEKPENAEVVVMLIDANTGKIINAAKKACVNHTVGVDEVDTDSDANATGDVYSITGVRVMRGATISDVNRLDKGIYIFNGKKIVVR